MPGLCVLIHASAPSSDSRLDAMLGRMSKYPWFRTSRFADQAAGVEIGSVVLDGSAASLWTGPETVAVIDGELYEAEVERRRLQAAGATFDGTTDAELLARGWLHGGAAFLERLHGCFSAVLWRRDARECLVITDRFGMRPIYVAESPRGVSVASEIKALLADPDLGHRVSEPGIAQFFTYGHFLNDDTFFGDIRAVPPATCLTYRYGDRAMVEQRYWRVRPSHEVADSRELLGMLDDAIVAGVERRAARGERLGLSLSAGLDARTILGLAPKGVDLQTVSLGIDGSIDHRGAAELARIAGVPHHPYVLDGSFLSSFERHLRSMVLLTDGHYLDQGIVMPTLPTYRNLGIQFLLRGHGGELLHMRKAYAYSVDGSVFQRPREALESWLYEHLSGYMIANVPRELFTADLAAAARASLRTALDPCDVFETPIERISHLFLTERLHRETALSMQMFNGFATVRLPYVDNEVVDVLFRLPGRLKLGDELQTAIMRRHCPAFLSIVNSNTGARVGAGRVANELGRLRMRVSAKLGVRGFQPYERLGLWLKRELRPLVERIVLGDELLSRKMFRPDVVRRVVEQHVDGRANHTFLIMALLVFELGQQMLRDPEGFRDVESAA